MKDINLFPKKDSIFLKKIKSKTDLKKDENCDGYFLQTSESEARRIIDSLKGKNKIIALQGGDDAFNRRAIETLKIDYLISPEGGKKRDTLKQRDSGINHVTAKEAKRKNISLVISMSEIRNLQKKEKALRLERIIQNIKVCRKVNCQLKIASLTDNKKNTTDEISRKTFGESLGMSSEQAKDSTNFKTTI